jgi:sporulation protein YlmC with PRC-barrel domain
VRLELGSPVRLADGTEGALSDVVVDPVAGRVTHLVVLLGEREDTARLVPVAMASGDAVIGLTCARPEFDALEHVREVAFLRLDEAPQDDPDWQVGIERPLGLPYYPAADGFDGVGTMPLETQGSIAYDRIPKDTVEIRRASRVTSCDGHDLGHVDGFVVEGDHITHVVLERGHLWSRREVTIPVTAVAEVRTDAVVLSLTRDAVGDLPSVRVRRH